MAKQPEILASTYIIGFMPSATWPWFVRGGNGRELFTATHDKAESLRGMLDFVHLKHGPAAAASYANDVVNSGGARTA